MLENLKDQVVEQLKLNPACRNSDITLTIEIWKAYYPEKIRQIGERMAVELKDLYDLPREDNVKRVRAKIQELVLKRIADGKATGNEYLYLPTDEKIAKQRQINEVIWKKALGYNTAGLKQTEVLPRPVGLVGYSRIDKDHYVATGADQKQYNILATNGYWTCECKAFQFSSNSGSKTCKHIKEIQDHLDKELKARIAETQTNLF